MEIVRIITITDILSAGQNNRGACSCPVRTTFHYKLFLTYFQERQSARKLSEEDKMFTIWRASWAEEGVVCRVYSNRNGEVRMTHWSFHTDHMELFHWLVFYICTSPYSRLISMQVIALLLKSNLKWHSYCGSALCWWNRKHEQYRLQIHHAELYWVWCDFSLSYRVFVCYRVRWFAESDLAPTRDRKGLLSLSFAWVVFTPLSRIIPAWKNKMNYMSRVIEHRTQMLMEKKKTHTDERNSGVDFHKSNCVCSFCLCIFWYEYEEYENTLKASNSSCTQALRFF